jgi:beta-galactosidase
METTDGFGIEFKGEHPFNLSAQALDTNILRRARSQYQLKPHDFITFNFEYATSEVGCTAVSVLNQYRVLPNVYQFTIKARPYKK